jgi:lipid-binding SYLF domain-containing protein
MSLRTLFTAGLVFILAASTFAQTVRRDTLAARIETCEAILREFMDDPDTAIPAHVLREARAIVIANEFEFGVGLGAKGGYAIVMVRRADGTWSLPAFLRAGNVSLGLQLGGTSVNTVYVLNTPEAVRLLYQARFNFGASAGAVAGPRAAFAEEATQIIKAPVFVYQKNLGLFAGARVKTGWLSRSDDLNRIFYNTDLAMPELLHSDSVPPPVEVLPLLDFVRRIAG